MENINQTTVMIHKVTKVEFGELQFFPTFASRQLIITQGIDGIEIVTEIELFGEKDNFPKITIK